MHPVLAVILLALLLVGVGLPWGVIVERHLGGGLITTVAASMAATLAWVPPLVFFLHQLGTGVSTRTWTILAMVVLFVAGWAVYLYPQWRAKPDTSVDRQP